MLLVPSYIGETGRNIRRRKEKYRKEVEMKSKKIQTRIGCNASVT